MEIKGPSSSTVTWLGTMRMPGQLVPLCRPMLVSRVAGMPSTRQVNIAVSRREVPMSSPDMTPSSTPG